MISFLFVCLILFLKMITSKNEIHIKPTSNSLMAIDFITILIISLAICLASHELVFMSFFVPLVILMRFVLIDRMVNKTEINIKTEIPFFILITLLGAFNDWNSVSNKKIYDYTVPHYFEFSSIPMWMLIYWGMILRAIYSFSKWSFLKPQAKLNNIIGLKKYQITNPGLKIISELMLVFITRQFIYKYYLDPILSWIPFVIALIIWLLFFKVNRHDIKLLFVFLLVGPLVEIIYIKIGHLHYYHLGLIYGVPVWIIIWWLIIVLIWKDLAPRMEYFIAEAFRKKQKNISDNIVTRKI